MKILTFAIILFLAYRMIIKPALLGAGRQQRPLDDRQDDDFRSNPSRTSTKTKASDEGEYVDYEEVD